MKLQEEILEQFDLMVGRCFEVAQQQKYGFMDSIEARKKIEEHSLQYRTNIKRIISKYVK